MESNLNETNAPKSKFIEQNIDPNQQSSRTGPTPRELIAMRKESKKLEEESQLTFQPKFSAKPKDDGSKTSSSTNGTTAGGSRFDKLYSEAMKRQQDNIEHPKPVANAEDLTFKPKISSRASSRSKRAPSPINVTDRLYSQSGAGRTSSKQLELPPPTFQPQISKRAISVERNKSKEISDRLYSLGKEHQEKLERMKQDYTNQKLQQECTFAPKINLNGTGSRSRSSSTSRSVNGNNTTMTSESSSKTNITSGYISTNDVTNRLLNYEERRLAKLEEAKKQQLALESQTATFKPTVVLTKRASTPNRQPGETVFDKLSKQMLQKDILSPPPAMNADTIHKTGTASTGAGGDGKVFERLAAVNNDRQHMQAVLDKVKHGLELSGCTFQPQVNTSNAHNTAGSHAKPIHQRLDEETEKWKEDRKKREELKRQEELKGATFTPVIPARSAAIGHSNNGTQGGTIFDRLTSEAERLKENQEYRMEQRRLEEMKDATFSPTLPQKSLELTSNRSPSRRAATPTNSAPTSPTHRTATIGAGADSFTSPPPSTYSSAESSTAHHHYRQQQQQQQSDIHSANTVVATTPIALNKTSSHTSSAASHITTKSVTSIPSTTTTTTKRTPASSTSSAFKESSGYTALSSSARGSFKGSLRNNNNNNCITPVVTPSATTGMNNNTSSRQSLSHTPVLAVTKRPTTTATTLATTTAPITVTPLTVNTSSVTGGGGGAGVSLKRHVTDRTSPRTPNEVSTNVTSPVAVDKANSTHTPVTGTTTSKSSKNGNSVATTGIAKGKNINTGATTAAVTSEKGANTNNSSTKNNNSSNNYTASNNNSNNNIDNISQNRSLKTTSSIIDDQLPIGIPTLRGQRKSIGNMQVVTASADVAAAVEEEENIVKVTDTDTDDTSSGINDTTINISTTNNSNNSDDPVGIFESAPVAAGTTNNSNIIKATLESVGDVNGVESEKNGISSTLENLVVVDDGVDNEIAVTTTAAISTSDLLAGIEAYDDDDDDDDEGSMSIVTEALPTARLDPDDTEYAVSSLSAVSSKKQQPFTIVEADRVIENNDDEGENEQQQPLNSENTTTAAVTVLNASCDDEEEEFY